MYKITHEGGHVATRNHDDRRPPEVGDVVGGHKVSKVERVGDHPGLTLAGKIGHGLAHHENTGTVPDESLAKWAKEYDGLHTDHKTYARHELHDRGILSEDHMDSHHLTGDELMSHVNDGLNMMRRRHHSATQKPGDSDHYVTRMRANDAY